MATTTRVSCGRPSTSRLLRTALIPKKLDAAQAGLPGRRHLIIGTGKANRTGRGPRAHPAVLAEGCAGAAGWPPVAPPRCSASLCNKTGFRVRPAGPGIADETTALSSAERIAPVSRVASEL